MKKKHENRKNPLLILPTPSIPFQKMDPKTQGPSKREGAPFLRDFQKPFIYVFLWKRNEMTLHQNGCMLDK